MVTYRLVDVREVDKVAPFFSSAYHGWLHDPAMVVYCAMEDDLVVGAIGILLGETVAKILCLSVSPDYQRQGIGSGLVAQAQADLEFYECQSLQVTFSLDLENTWAIVALFAHADFDMMALAPTCRTCKVKDLLQTPIGKKALQQSNKHIVPLESVPPVALKMYGNQFQLELNQRELDGALSMVSMDKGKLTGVLGIQKSGEQEIDAFLLHVAPGHSINLILLMVATAVKALQIMGADCTFSAALATSAGQQLLDKLLPIQEDETPDPFICMSWKPE